jgi:hypothetical protein
VKFEAHNTREMEIAGDTCMPEGSNSLHFVVKAKLISVSCYHRLKMLLHVKDVWMYVCASFDLEECL